MHHKRKKARINSVKGSRKTKFPNGAPMWWNICFNTRPKRRRDAEKIRKVMKGFDPDGIVWETGNRRPHLYFW